LIGPETLANHIPCGKTRDFHGQSCLKSRCCFKDDRLNDDDRHAFTALSKPCGIVLDPSGATKPLNFIRIAISREKPFTLLH